MSRRTIIGLTGNIATGKSAVMHMAAERGALTLDADKIVHELLDGDVSVQSAVVEAFGPSVRWEDGRINRAALGRIVFADPDKLVVLERLIHPAVQAAIARRLSESTAAVVMIEAIKLLEGPLARLCDQVWVTTSSRQTQLERLRVCRGLDEAAAVARIDAQGPQEDKISRADVVINTNGLMTDTQQQFDHAWSELPSVEQPSA